MAQRRSTPLGEDVVTYLHPDHLGSTSLATDAAGNVVARRRYYPYGAERWRAGERVTDFGYTGQRDVVGTGLMYYKARYYYPGLGRFIQADTIVPEPGNPQALNRYAYVKNNPLIYIDPSGHFGDEVVEKYGNGNPLWDTFLREGELGDLVLYGYEGENPLYAIFVLSASGELTFWTLSDYGGKEASIEFVRGKIDSERAALYRNVQFAKEGGPAVGLMSAEVSLMGPAAQFYDEFYQLLGGTGSPSNISLSSNWYINNDTSHVRVQRHVTGLNFSFDSIGAFLTALFSDGGIRAAIDALPAGWVASKLAEEGGENIAKFVPVVRYMVAAYAIDQSFTVDTTFRVTPGMGPLPVERCPTPAP